MNEKTLDRLYNKNIGKWHDFYHIADHMVENYTSDLSDERKMHISEDVAVGLTMGSAMVKNKYLLIGAAIGIGGSALTIGIVNKINKKRIKEYQVEVATDNEINLIHISATSEKRAAKIARQRIKELFDLDFDELNMRLVDRV